MNINHKPAEMDFRDQIKDRSADICNPPTFPVLSAAADGNQPPSGPRGDQGAPRTSGADTRDPSSSVSAAETLLKEKIAALQHEQWRGWMRHLFSKAHTERNGDVLVIPKTWWTRWLRQMDASYAELREDERDSDRIEADKVLALFTEFQALLPASPSAGEGSKT